MGHSLPSVVALIVSAAVAAPPFRLYAAVKADRLALTYAEAADSSHSAARNLSARQARDLIERLRQFSNLALNTQSQQSLTPHQRELYDEARSAVRELQIKHG